MLIQKCFVKRFQQRSLHEYIYLLLEIKTFSLGSRIQDMALWDKLNIELKCQPVFSLQCFWPLTASITSELKINHAYAWRSYHERYLQQIHSRKLLCGMYDFMAKSSIATLNICQILMRLSLDFSLKFQKCATMLGQLVLKGLN